MEMDSREKDRGGDVKMVKKRVALEMNVDLHFKCAYGFFLNHDIQFESKDRGKKG